MAQKIEHIGFTEVLFNTFGIDRPEVRGNFNAIELNINFYNSNGQPQVTPALLAQYNKCRVNINNGQYIGGLGSYLIYCALFYTDRNQYLFANYIGNPFQYGINFSFFRFKVDTPLIKKIEFLNDTPVSIILHHGFAQNHPKLNVHYLMPRENYSFPERKKNVMFCYASGFEDMLPAMAKSNMPDVNVDNAIVYKTLNDLYYKRLIHLQNMTTFFSVIYDGVGYDSVLTMNSMIAEKLVVIYQE